MKLRTRHMPTKKHGKDKYDRKEIPSEYKCSRCKKDMRIKDEYGGCECSKSHCYTTVGNKSGNAFWKAEIDYNGR